MSTPPPRFDTFLPLGDRQTPRGYRRLNIGSIRHYVRHGEARTACGRMSSWEDASIAELLCETCVLGTDRSRSHHRW